MKLTTTSCDVFSSLKPSALPKRIPPLRSSLRANFSWTLLGQIVYNGSQWAIVIAMAKLGSPEMVGQYTLALAITAPVFMFSSLNLAAMQATDARDEFSFGEYLGLRIISSCVAFVPVTLVLTFGGYSGETSKIVLLIALAKLIESCSDIVFGSLQKHERMDLIARSLAIKGVLSASVVVAALLTFGSQSAAIIGVVLVGLAMCSFDLRNAAAFSSVRPSLSRRAFVTLAVTALPLGVVAGLNTLNVQLPRFFVERSHGARELGIFGAIATLAFLGQTVSTALSRAAAPRLSRLYANGEKAAFLTLLRRLVCGGALIGAVGLAGAWLFGHELLTLFYTAEYAEKQDVLMWIMVSMGVLTTATFLGTALTAARAFKVQMRIHLCKICITMVMCIVLIPRFGTVAAAWSMAAASSFSALVYLGVVMQLLRKRNVAASNVASAG